MERARRDVASASADGDGRMDRSETVSFDSKR